MANPYPDRKTKNGHKDQDGKREKCWFFGECSLVDNDATHANRFEHPEFCRDCGLCTNMDENHLYSYRHVQLCRYRLGCFYLKEKSVDHCQKYRHCIQKCNAAHFCYQSHNGEHFKDFHHPFNQPCPLTPFRCPTFDTLFAASNVDSLPYEVRKHCSEFSHICPDGRLCGNPSDNHWKNTIHIARKLCSDFEKCRQLNDETHLNSLSHIGIRDIGRLCKCPADQCRERKNADHVTKLRHNYNRDRIGVMASFRLNEQINFYENQARLLTLIQNYTKNLNPKEPFVIPSEITQWIRSLRPIHRCSGNIFQLILLHGHVMSREHMEHLKDPLFVAHAVEEHNRIRAIFDRHKDAAMQDRAKTYIHAIIAHQYSAKHGISSSSVIGPRPTEEHKNIMQTEQRSLKHMLSDDEIKEIESCARSIAEASLELHNSPTGIKYQPDKELGTDKHVFSVLGPHLGHYYGDIYLVFKNDVMLHPDTNVTPQAATSYRTGRTFHNRRWEKDPQTETARLKCFHQSKIHCAVPQYEETLAAEIMAITGVERNTVNVDLKSIIRRWTRIDAHQAFEAHLPKLISLDYIEDVYMPQNLFDSLTPEAQTTAKNIFDDALHITPHNVNLTDLSPQGGPVPNDKKRADYQDYVTNLTVEKIEQRINSKFSTMLQGITITLPPSKMRTHVLLPLTLKGALSQYRSTEGKDSNPKYVNIYWEALYGDMMLSLSDEPIDPKSDQSNIQCLVCYIAEKPKADIQNYNESYSYLNAEDPFKHDAIMSNEKAAVSSKTFHRGSNIEDFVTYWLKIELNTGYVTLSHAGPNGIYCFETLSCRFAKSLVDFSKLNYIHVSAGGHKLSIRNLVVSLEKIQHLHPEIDKDFRKGNKRYPSDKGNIHHTYTARATHSPSGLQPCHYGSDCYKQNDDKHCAEYSHPSRE